jgi:hypothetical protein
MQQMWVKRDHKFGLHDTLAYWMQRRDCCQTSDLEAMFPEQDGFVGLLIRHKGNVQNFYF